MIAWIDLLPADIAFGWRQMLSVQTIESLLYEVNVRDSGMLTLPALTIFGAAVLAAVPAMVRAGLGSIRPLCCRRSRYMSLRTAFGAATSRAFCAIT
ncbi:MAG TPA: hypothetical protein VH325_14405 [Bryobacteraceae bacterium]|jgi:hypothetical protein|nr:hypothetical protein [Bryobacteraceae bacterium]